MSVPIPLIAISIRGRILVTAVDALVTKLSTRTLKSWLSSAIPVTRLLHADFVILTEPSIVVLASFAVVPVMSISSCTT